MLTAARPQTLTVPVTACPWSVGIALDKKGNVKEACFTWLVQGCRAASFPGNLTIQLNVFLVEYMYMAGLGDYFLLLLHTASNEKLGQALRMRPLSTSRALTSESSNFHSPYCQCNCNLHMSSIDQQGTLLWNYEQSTTFPVSAIHEQPIFSVVFTPCTMHGNLILHMQCSPASEGTAPMLLFE